MSDIGLWFKLWCASDDDDDLDNLDIADYGRWCKLGTHTKAHGTNGTVKITAPARTLCAKLQVANFDELEALIKRFPNVSEERKVDHVTGVTNATVTLIVTWHNWAKYQGDFSRERVRKYRAKKQRGVTDRGEEKRRDEKRRDEKRREEIVSQDKFNPLDDDRFMAWMAEACAFFAAWAMTNPRRRHACMGWRRADYRRMESSVANHLCCRRYAAAAERWLLHKRMEYQTINVTEDTMEHYVPYAFERSNTPYFAYKVTKKPLDGDRRAIVVEAICTNVFGACYGDQLKAALDFNQFVGRAK